MPDIMKVNLNELLRENSAVEVDWPNDDNIIPSETLNALLSIDGVEGVGVSGVRELCVYIRDIEVRQRLPERIDGFCVSSQCTGVVRSQ